MNLRRVAIVFVVMLLILFISIKMLMPSIVFPITFLPQGLPASGQRLLKTPWGKIAIYQSGTEYLKPGRAQVIYCHGNGHCLDHSTKSICDDLSGDLRMAVTALEYPGYGLSDGYPNETSVNGCLDELIRRLPRTSPVILIGRSIGTGPCVEYASLHPNIVRKMVLISPFLSIIRTKLPFSIPGLDMFPTVDRIKSVRCPTLVLHGSRDEIVPFQHGQRIAAECPKGILVAHEAGHNDLVWRSDAVEFIGTQS